jgi:CMP-N-acetylneuraminic acid synthetase
MNILGIIPARGGSKGIPRKNIKLLAGKPLIAWTIGEAKKSRYINRLIVSTDDKEIAEVAKSYGAEVPFLRPAEISHDLATDRGGKGTSIVWSEYQCRELSPQPSSS